MSSASSAAVATPLAMVRILLFICCGLLMVKTVIAVVAKELEGKQSIQDRSIDGDNGDMETECLNVGGEIYHEKCYFFSDVHELKNYDDAMEECIKKQGELAIFADFPYDGLRIVDHRDTGDPRYWVGGRDKDAEGGWQWENGEFITWPYYQPPWGNHEPNGQGHEKCLDILSKGDHHGYNDESCDKEHQYICEIGCSFAGEIYPPGSFIHEACAQLQCNGTTGRFDSLAYDDHCSKCWVMGDPHIWTFDQTNTYYDYQRCGNHTLTQNGNSYTPSYAVYASFASCTAYPPHLACLKTITFKNDNQTFITTGWQNKLTIQVNGNNYNTSLLSTSPSIIKVGDTDYPILAWISTSLDCVSLQGSSGIKVKYCRGSGNANSVWVWASPDIVNGLKGICGTPNGNVGDDLTTRDGSTTYTMETKPNVAFGLSWSADTRYPGQSCWNSRMSTESACETNTSLQVIFQNQCEDAILNGAFTAETEQSQILIDTCVYDVCVATDPVKGIEAVHAAMPIHAHIKENTVDHCHHKRTHRCKTHKGTCILKTETCDGTIIERGCHGRKCDCCAPSGCEPSPKCLAMQGKCQLLKDAMNCEGIVNSELCSGNKCACCYPEASDKVKERKQCLDVKGKCMLKKKWENCDGKLKKSWCKGKYWACCYSQ